MFLENKTVWIVGGSSGIGKALAIECAKQKARIILSARNLEKLEKTKEVCLKHCPTVSVIGLDYEEKEALPEKIARALEVHDGIDYLFLSSGISQRSFTFETQMHVYRRLMEVNYFGSVALTKGVLGSMLKKQSGHIIVISSIAGKFGTPLRSGYAAAKHALAGFFESLAAEVYENNIYVTMIYPGYIKTEITRNSLTHDGTKYNKIDESVLNGIAPRICARKILDAVAKKKNEVVIAKIRERAAVYLKRFFPRILFKLVRKLNPL